MSEAMSGAWTPRYNPACPFTAAEMREMYEGRLLSCEDIARLAAARTGAAVSKVKAREWLRAAGIPVRTFSQAAAVRALKNRGEKVRPA